MTIQQTVFFYGIIVGFAICVMAISFINLVLPKKRRHRFYFTLEEDLTYCFKRRGIQVKEMIISDGASKYTIRVIR
jgi:hypothetical protein